jgi:serpin B
MRNYRGVLVAFVLFAFIAIVSCSQLPLPPAGDNTAKDARSDKPRDKTPQIEAAELEKLVAGNTRFALNLYHRLDKDENLFYSPFSISLALAMTYAGARTETEKQMAQALNFMLSQERLHPAFNALELDFVNRSLASQQKEGKGFQLSIANALWGQQDFSFLGSFLDTLAENYGAGMSLLDFYNAAEASRLVINQWVSDQTKEKIKDLLPEGSIKRETRLVLTNAIYFKAPWRFPFEEAKTKDGLFTMLNGKTASVPMMHQEIRSFYAQDENSEFFSLPYHDPDLSMLFLVPKAGKFSEWEEALNYDYVTGSIQKLADTMLVLAMPKFSYTARIDLKDKLAELGMPIAFDETQSDFSGMNGKKNLRITDVFHKAFVAINEAGTEAAAATGVVVSVDSAPPTVHLTVDRPFLFMIYDSKTGTILFIGRMLDPAK